LALFDENTVTVPDMGTLTAQVGSVTSDNRQPSPAQHSYSVTYLSSHTHLSQVSISLIPV